MPEDLMDKLVDFELMLEGILNDEAINKTYSTRILNYWYDLVADIKKSAENEH